MASLAHSPRSTGSLSPKGSFRSTSSSPSLLSPPSSPKGFLTETNQGRLRDLFSGDNITTIDLFLNANCAESATPQLAAFLLKLMQEEDRVVIRNILRWITRPGGMCIWRKRIHGKNGDRCDFWRDCIKVCTARKYMEGINRVIDGVYVPSRRHDLHIPERYFRGELLPVLDEIDDLPFTQALFAKLQPYLMCITAKGTDEAREHFVEMMERGCIPMIEWYWHNHYENQENHYSHFLQEYFPVENFGTDGEFLTKMHVRTFARLARSDMLGNEFACMFLKDLIVQQHALVYNPYVDVCPQEAMSMLFRHIQGDQRYWEFLCIRRHVTWSFILATNNVDMILEAVKTLPFQSHNEMTEVLNKCLNELRFDVHQWRMMTDHVRPTKAIELHIRSIEAVDVQTVIQILRNPDPRFEVFWYRLSILKQLKQMYDMENEFEIMMTWLKTDVLAAKISGDMPAFYKHVFAPIMRNHGANVNVDFYETVTNEPYNMWKITTDIPSGMPEAWRVDVRKIMSLQTQLETVEQDLKRLRKEAEDRIAMPPPAQRPPPVARRASANV